MAREESLPDRSESALSSSSGVLVVVVDGRPEKQPGSAESIIFVNPDERATTE